MGFWDINSAIFLLTPDFWFGLSVAVVCIHIRIHTAEGFSRVSTNNNRTSSLLTSFLENPYSPPNAI